MRKLYDILRVMIYGIGQVVVIWVISCCQPMPPYSQADWETVPVGSRVEFFAEGKPLGLIRRIRVASVDSLAKNYSIKNLRSWAFSVHLQKTPDWATQTSIYVNGRRMGAVAGK